MLNFFSDSIACILFLVVMAAASALGAPYGEELSNLELPEDLPMPASFDLNRYDFH